MAEDPSAVICNATGTDIYSIDMMIMNADLCIFIGPFKPYLIVDLLLLKTILSLKIVIDHIVSNLFGEMPLALKAVLSFIHMIFITDISLFHFFSLGDNATFYIHIVCVIISSSILQNHTTILFHFQYTP